MLDLDENFTKALLGYTRSYDPNSGTCMSSKTPGRDIEKRWEFLSHKEAPCPSRQYPS